jgi:hypothetical protein
MQLHWCLVDLQQVARQTAGIDGSCMCTKHAMLAHVQQSHFVRARHPAAKLLFLQAKPGAPAGADEYNAFFYTLVSTDTQVMSVSALDV